MGLQNEAAETTSADLLIDRTNPGSYAFHTIDHIATTGPADPLSAFRPWAREELDLVPPQPTDTFDVAYGDSAGNRHVD